VGGPGAVAVRVVESFEHPAEQADHELEGMVGVLSEVHGGLKGLEVRVGESGPAQ
jgi:hypothetical protein